MSVFIDDDSKQTVSIVRHTAFDTKSTLHSAVTMDIQPTGGGAQVQGMRLTVQHTHHGFVIDALSDVEIGDAIQREGKKDLYVWRIDESADVQEFILGETPTPA